MSDDHVPDAVYDDARAQFNEKELADLTLAIAAINAWNRLSIAARLTPGTYQPAPAEPGAVTYKHLRPSKPMRRREHSVGNTQ